MFAQHSPDADFMNDDVEHAAEPAWASLPTGCFTHQLADLPSPIDDTPEPPERHASSSHASGFCRLNNIVAGVLWAKARCKLERIAAADFDVHYGNGAEKILANRPGFLFMPLFQRPLFPNACAAPTPENVVCTLLSAGAAAEEFCTAVEEAWMSALCRFKPQLLLTSEGFDAHGKEHIAQPKVCEMDRSGITRRLMDAACDLCEGRLASVLKGGRAIRSLARSALSHVQTLIGQS